MADQQFTIKLTVNSKEFRGELLRAGELVRGFGRTSADSGRQAAAGYTAAAQGVRSISQQLAQARAALVGILSLREGLRALASVKNVVVEFERYNAQLKTLTGSSHAAAAAFEQLKTFAATTPYGLDQSLQTFILLKARGIDPTVESMTGLGNVAAAMGKDITEVTNSALQASVGNLETMRAMGFEVALEGDQMRVTFDGVTRTIDKSAQALVDYFAEIGQSRFGGAMSEQMKTLGGAISNVGDAAQVTVKALSDQSGLTGAMTQAAQATAEALEAIGRDPAQTLATLRAGIDALAVVLATRLGPALTTLAVRQYEAVRATVAKITAQRAALATEKAAAAQAVVSARAAAARTAAAVAEAQAHLANVKSLSIYGAQRAAAERAVTAALAQQAAAQNALTAAQTRAQVAARATLGLGRGLLTLVGGLPGLLAAAGVALLLWSQRTDQAAQKARDAIERANALLETYRQQRSGVAPEALPLVQEIDLQRKAYAESQARLEELLRTRATLEEASPYGAGGKISQSIEAEIKLSRELADTIKQLSEEYARLPQGTEVPETATPDRGPVDDFLSRYRTDQERLNDEIAAFRELSAKANLAEEEVLAGIERIKAAFAKKDKTRTDDDGLREIERLVAQLQTERDTLGLTEEQVRAYNIEKLRSKAAGDVAAQAALDTAAALNQEVAALEAAEETHRRLDDAKRRVLDEVDPNAPLLRELELIEELKAAYPEYAAAFDEAALRIHERMDELGETSEATGDSMTEMAVQAARNIQSSFADFLFDPFQDGMNGMLSSFVTTIRRMLSELLAAQALRAFFNSMSGLGGGVGSLFGSLAANVKHTGGLAGTGPMRSIPALAFVGAPRYHSGGLAGDEVPAILQRGEEVLTRDDPRHQANGGGSAQGVRIVNVIDPAMTRDYLTSSEGERTILNVLAANQGAVRQILA